MADGAVGSEGSVPRGGVGGSEGLLSATPPPSSVKHFPERDFSVIWSRQFRTDQLSTCCVPGGGLGSSIEQERCDPDSVILVGGGVDSNGRGGNVKGGCGELVGEMEKLQDQWLTLP